MEYRAVVAKMISSIDDETVLKVIYNFLKGFLP